MLTIKEAWELIASACDKTDDTEFWLLGHPWQGMCNAIHYMEQRDKIDWNTRCFMLDVINKELGEHQVYLFPRTKEGHKLRAEFCRRQIDAN